jgi:two-component system, NarL family, sensor kinase
MSVRRTFGEDWGASMNLNPRPGERPSVFDEDLGLLFPELASLAPNQPIFEPADTEPASVEMFQQIINGLPEQIALLDADWKILAVNVAWTKTAAQYGYGDLLPGANYLQFCRSKSAEGHTPAGLVVDGIAQIESGQTDSHRFVYHGRERWSGHAFQLCIKRLQISGRIFATVTRYDVSELAQLRQLREGFSHSLMESQDQERRRFARELHDSTMQLLAGLGLAMGQLKRASKPDATVDIVAEMEQLLGEAQRELRSISYLAHPPLLKEMGLADALRALAEGFARRTGLRISFHMGDDLVVHWRTAEVVLYRVVQEALSNVHRHAHATDAAVTLVARKDMVHAVIIDNGIGMPTPIRHGVGLPGMRARLNELGGRLTVRPASPGTMLIASLSLRPCLRAVGDLSLHG